MTLLILEPTTVHQALLLSGASPALCAPERVFPRCPGTAAMGWILSSPSYISANEAEAGRRRGQAKHRPSREREREMCWGRRPSGRCFPSSEGALHWQRVAPRKTERESCVLPVEVVFFLPPSDQANTKQTRPDLRLAAALSVWLAFSYPMLCRPDEWMPLWRNCRFPVQSLAN